MGSALFCIESVFDKIIIYDCGGQNVSFVNTRIDNLLAQNTEIEAVFISHFHRDHINGIRYLLQKCKVKNLFVPQREKGELFFHKYF